MLPTRTLSAVCEITKASLVITSRPPIYTGESGAMRLIIQLKNNGDDYSPASARAEAYLYYQDTEYMSEAIEMEIVGNVISCLMPASMTARAGGPLLTIQLKDLSTDHVLVAAAAPIQITNVLGSTVITTRPPTPSEVVYVGKAPYINSVTLTWMEWDNDAGEYVDTGVEAYGRPASFTATASGLPAGSAPTASITGTADAPVLNLGIPKGDQGETGPQGPQGPKGDKGDKGDSGASVDTDVSSDAISGADNVHDALISLSDKIDDLLIADYDSSDGSIVFRSADVALYDSSDGSITINV